MQEVCANVESYGMCAPHTEKTHPATLQGRGNKNMEKGKTNKEAHKMKECHGHVMAPMVAEEAEASRIQSIGQNFSDVISGS